MKSLSNAEGTEKVITAQNLGIKYDSSHRREDIRSLSFEILLGRRMKSEDFWALNGVSFDGFAGEVLGVIGSNGAGKTTLCKTISGILRPDKGSININGEVSALLSMGAGFKNELTGRENVFLNGMMLGIPKKEIKKFYNSIHQFSGLGDFIQQPVKYYSSGMRARLGFSIAAMLEPEILVLDETLSTGDMEFGKKASQKIKELVEKAKMVIVVTHNIGFIEKNCTRAVWIDAGTVKADGAPEEVAALYKQSIPERKKKRKILQVTETISQVKDKEVVTVKNLGVKFKLGKNTFWPLKNVDFSIKEGEIVGIIGHNGAGKSTLCRALCGIYKPDEGSVKVKGDTSALLGLKTGFNNQLSGSDNIILNGLMMGIPKKKIFALKEEIIDFAELSGHIDKPVKHYSSGMRSRLGFSIASSIQPDLFIIDEALSAGDISFQEKASERMQEMITNARAVIVVSHSNSFVEKVCTRAIWINKGEVMFDGDPKEAVALYKKHVKETSKKKAKLG
ncbi:ABC transporter ATP-binding protein [Dethiobacter alkaliphilus]|uniref:ABC transporter related protein n=1 Tax=Dethiobacter alkaliphilus AHT 1 TaxID=555088 RepID=C0GGU1_DETAL|nr:ABC transporter ATP-binding protein [Dethiobacter alkaliphilus]EEG77532.1 ABC transporter related protein [Dethiobacter alkaliphilus AHT 1]